MKTIITGASGFIGQRLVGRLADEKYDVLALDRTSSGKTYDSVTCLEVDLNNPEAFLKHISGPCTVIHLAWDMDRFGQWAGQSRQIALLARLLDSMQACEVVRFIGMGSAEEYGVRAGILAEKDPPVMPQSAYGWAKRAARNLLEAYSLRSGIPVLWVRPFAVYGPHQRGDMLIPYAMHCSREGIKAEFTDGEQYRDFVYVDDVVDALVRGIKLKEPVFSEVNIGSGTAVQVKELLGMIEKQSGQNDLFQLGAKPRRLNDPELQQADITQAARLINWHPTTALADGLDNLFSLERNSV